MVNVENLIPQTISLVDEAKGRIYRYKEITVASDHSCVLTYTPVDSSIQDDIRLHFDSLPEVLDVIRELKGTDLFVAAIVELKESSFDDDEQECEEVTSENFEERCQKFAADIDEVLQVGIKTGNTGEALQLAGDILDALPSVIRVRVIEISRQRAIKKICEILSGEDD